MNVGGSERVCMDIDGIDATATAAETLDDEDPLSSLRERFDLPDEWYLDGNSLGPASVESVAALEHVIEEWRTLGIRGWTEANPPWFWYGERLGDRVADLVGANGDEVVVGNSTTVNIHTLIGTFLDHADGTKVVVNELDFPTDHYAIRSQLRARGLDPDEHLVVVESDDGRTISEDDVREAMDSNVAILFFPSILYRSGQLFDIETLTKIAHEYGAFAGFDLAHSVGAVPHDLHALDVDFAVWCHYKYVNAGPGAVAGLYVNERHHGVTPALAGWWGHDKETQFEMALEYTPAQSAGAWQIGTVPIFAAAPLDGALSVLEEVGMAAIREKSIALTEYLIALSDERLAQRGVRIGSPRAPAERGGHVALEHDCAYALGDALRGRGYIVDVRPPDVVRVCPSPLYIGFHDVWSFVDAMVDILDSESLENSEKRGVT